jgi:hypothetical protein
VKVLALFLSILLAVQPVVAAEDYEIAHWGRVVRVPADQVEKFFGYSFFLSVTKGNQVYGYPIEPENKKVENAVLKLEGKFVKVEGKIGKRSVRGEGAQTLDVIYLAKVEDFPLSNIGVDTKKKNVIDQNMDPMPSQKPVVKKGGKGVSDKVTNAILFGAGAVLMGNLVKGLMDK